MYAKWEVFNMCEYTLNYHSISSDSDFEYIYNKWD